MALNDNQLKNAIKSIMDAMVEVEDYEAAKEQYAILLVAALKQYIMSGTVTTTGTATTQTGVIT